jgi:hypothetical protein
VGSLVPPTKPRLLGHVGTVPRGLPNGFCLRIDTARVAASRVGILEAAAIGAVAARPAHRCRYTSTTGSSCRWPMPPLLMSAQRPACGLVRLPLFGGLPDLVPVEVHHGHARHVIAYRAVFDASPADWSPSPESDRPSACRGRTALEDVEERGMCQLLLVSSIVRVSVVELQV